MAIAVFFLCLFFVAFLLFLFCLFLKMVKFPPLYRNTVDRILDKMADRNIARRVLKFFLRDIDTIIDKNISITARTILYCLVLSLLGLLSLVWELKFVYLYLLTFFLCTAGMFIYSVLLDRFVADFPITVSKEKKHRIQHAAIRILALAIFVSGCFWGAAVAAEYTKPDPGAEAEINFSQPAQSEIPPVLSQAPASAGRPIIG